ncbi:MAG: methyltransferase domain-containing protein [Candidatus Acidoferrales bacterium]
MRNSDWRPERLYEVRFSPAERKHKEALWRILCSRFLQEYVSRDATVVDLGAGFCEFINHIECQHKFAVDTAAHTPASARAGVAVRSTLSELEPGSADLVFCSNFFEHLPDKETMVATLAGIRRVLAPQGRLMIIQPNIYYAYREYWDYFDHYLALSHRSMEEILRATGFRILRLIPRFLPYSTRSRLASYPFLLHLYLSLPFLRYLFGKQMFVLAEKQ